MPKLTHDEMTLIAQTLRYFYNARITDSLAARGGASDDLRRRAEAAGELALRFERAQVERARAIGTSGERGRVANTPRRLAAARPKGRIPEG